MIGGGGGGFRGRLYRISVERGGGGGSGGVYIEFRSKGGGGGGGGIAHPLHPLVPFKSSPVFFCPGEAVIGS